MSQFAESLPRVAYLGPQGTFTESALRQVFTPDEARYLPQHDVVSAIDAVRTGEADYAVVAIENSVEGGVSAVLDTLAIGSPLVILKEMLEPVSFTLAAQDIREISSLRTIAAHPHAWAQCRQGLKVHAPHAVHVPATSNTAAAQQLSRNPSEADAALVPPVAVQMYNLQTLMRDVSDNPDAVTRFVLIGTPRVVPAPTGYDKTTFVAHLPEDRSGSLLEMLEQLSTRGVNLSRIESRPLGDSLGRYSFSMDADGHIAEARMAEALQGLHRVCPYVRFLGSYPKARYGSQDATKTNALDSARPGTSDADYEAARAWFDEIIKGRGV